MAAWHPHSSQSIFLAVRQAVISHNALHVPVFHSPTLQRAFQLVLTGAYGQPASVYQPAHNRSHHRHTGTKQDLMRPTKLQYKWNVLNMIFAKDHAPGPTAGFKLAWRFYSTQWRTRPELVYTFLFEFAFAISFLGVAFWLSPRKALMYVWLPQHVSQSFINFINFLQHDGDISPPPPHCRNRGSCTLTIPSTRPPRPHARTPPPRVCSSPHLRTSPVRPPLLAMLSHPGWLQVAMSTLVTRA